MSKVIDEALGRWRTARDAEAFKSIVDTYATKIFAACRRMLGDTAEAEDVLQECFQALATAKVPPEGYVGPWLHRVAANLCFKRNRAAHRRKSLETAYASENKGAVELAWNDLAEHIDQAISGLSETHRVPVIAHFLEGETHADIANRLGVSRQTVTYRINKGVEHLRVKLKERGIVTSASSLTFLLTAHLVDAETLPASLVVSLGKIALGAAEEVAATTGAMSGVLSMKFLAFLGMAAMSLVVTVYWWKGFGTLPPPESEIAPPAAMVSEVVREVKATPAALVVSPISPEDETQEVEVEAAPRVVVSGRVLDASGHPVADVTVTGNAYGVEVQATTTTDSAGAYFLEGLLPTGSFDLKATLPGFDEALLVDLPLSTLGLNGIDLILDEEAAGRISGTVTWADGRPVANGTVHAGPRPQWGLGPGPQRMSSGDLRSLRCLRGSTN
jgi:RNA polymerase sigma factor (sigma-70 family)